MKQLEEGEESPSTPGVQHLGIGKNKRKLDTSTTLTQLC